MKKAMHKKNEQKWSYFDHKYLSSNLACILRNIFLWSCHTFWSHNNFRCTGANMIYRKIHHDILSKKSGFLNGKVLYYANSFFMMQSTNTCMKILFQLLVWKK